MAEISEPAHFDAVLRQAVERRVEIIVIDTMAEGFSMQSENDNSEMKRVVITPLKKLAKKTNACVLLVHHIGKVSEGTSGNASLYRGRGASSLAAAARLIINMDHMKDGNGVVVRDHVRVHCAKVKGRVFDDRIFRLNFYARWFEAVEIELPIQEASQDRVVGLVIKPMKRAEVIASVQEAGIEVTERTIERALSYGRKVGLLRKVGQIYHPTSLLSQRLGIEPEGSIEGATDEVRANGRKVLHFTSKQSNSTRDEENREAA